MMIFHFQVFLTIASYALATKLNPVHEWKYIEYDWDSQEQKKIAIDANEYNYTQIFTIDVQNVRDGRIFVTTPAFNPTGVPVTISTVSRKIGPGGPLLSPYPNWFWHNRRDCNGITSVWRVVVDECNRLWMLDSGKIGENQVCEAQLLVFDLRTDRLQQRIKIPNDISHDPRNRTLGLLITPIVETQGFNCERTWVYIGDVDGGGLIIWDGLGFRRLNNDVFDADPTKTTYTIAGESFTLADGIFSLALTPETSYHDYRRLFFRPLASLKQYSVKVNDLRRLATLRDVRYTTSKYQFPSQVAAQAFSKDGTLFYGLTTEIAIGCWNVNTPMDEKHVDIVAQDDENLQFASGIKVTKHPRNPRREQLWVTTNRFQKIATGTQNFDEINYRILSGSVDSLLQGSKCRLRGT